jgi:23S rRNA (pseudouridine1915-N3)-methyltransferase
VKLAFYSIGKTNHKYLNEGISFYTKRINHFMPFEVTELKIPKTKSKTEALETEKDVTLKNINESDYLILLDEKGKEMSSTDFSVFLQKRFLTLPNKIIFLAGGAYGFHQELYKRANDKIALSKMTFPHDLVRLVFLEQLYRAFTILKNTPYHH